MFGRPFSNVNDTIQRAVRLREGACLDGSDIYYLNNRARGRTLATFDGSIPVKAVKGASPETLTLIAPV